MITASALRANIYKLLDQTIESGRPLEIERKGRRLRIMPDSTTNRLERLGKRRIVNGDPEDLVHMDWSGEWKP